MANQINDGGPVFPSPWEPLPEGYFHPDNPVGQTPPKEVFGMSLRDWFAGQALAGMLANPAHIEMTKGNPMCAAWAIADAMLKARAAK